MEWSRYQKDIFAEAARITHDHCAVVARAGCAKTTSLIESLQHVPYHRVLLCAFNKSIQTEMANRAPQRVLCRTLHSLGLRLHQMNLKAKGRSAAEVVPEKGREQATALLEEKPEYYRVGKQAMPDDYGRKIDAAINLRKVAAFAKNVLAFQHEALVEIASQFDLQCREDEDKIARAAGELLNRAADDYQRVDFDDMAWFPWVFEYGKSPDTQMLQFDVVMVDERQDTSPAQDWMIQQMCRDGRAFSFLDDRQCHPPGVTVETDSGPVAIESLDPTKHKIRPWQRHGGQIVAGKRDFRIAHRTYTGDLVNVLAAGRTLPATPDHRFCVRWTNRDDVDTCVVYLMYRKGFGFRVGWCQLFEKRSRTLHVTHRARLEKADRLWVLQAFKNRTAASVYESQTAIQYGLPLSTFEPVAGAKHMTAEALTAIFSVLSRRQHFERGTACLRDHGLHFELPLYPWPDTEKEKPQGRRTLFTCYAANLLPDLMSVPLPDAKNEWATIQNTVRSPYSGPVYSLDVDTDHSYVANGLVTLNCIYSFRGVDRHTVERVVSESPVHISLPVSYRCPLAVIEKARLVVPDIQPRPGAPDGRVELVEYIEMLDNAQVGDFILSRTNAPLMATCLRLLQQGMPAVVAGRDIGESLRKMLKKSRAKTMPDLFRFLRDWLTKEHKRHMPEHPGRYERSRDRAACLDAVARFCQTPREVDQRLQDMFSDAEPTDLIVCSTVHKAKGLERDRVWMLSKTFGYPNVKPWQEAWSEENIWYVAVTRAKSELFFVETDLEDFGTRSATQNRRQRQVQWR